MTMRKACILVCMSVLPPNLMCTAIKAGIVFFVLAVSCAENGSQDTGGMDSGVDAGIDGSGNDKEDGADAGQDAAEDGADSVPAVLDGPPLVSGTSDSGFSLNAVIMRGDPDEVLLRYRKESDSAWKEAEDGTARDHDVIVWLLKGLEAGTVYEYQLVQKPARSHESMYSGEIVTAINAGGQFSFDLISDTHIYVNNPGETGETLQKVVGNMEEDMPDFVIHLGDILDFHDFGFNEPAPERALTGAGYMHYRRIMGSWLGRITHFSVIGNWDGENGDFTLEEIERSRSQRIKYMPGPGPETYPQGGSEYGDYYAFEWGDALFVVLNVMTYTPTGHYLYDAPGVLEDWTLGDRQLLWLENTLQNDSSKWKFIFIHHAVGGNGGNEADSAYGRGGGRAAYVGEQAVVHDLMQQHGVQIFFCGHDHVFYDMTVDGIHYTLPGSAGAPWKFSTLETGYPEGEYMEDSGHAKVTVGPESVKVEFINLEGRVIHSYTVE